MSKLKFFVTSANGMEVFYEPINSHTATHFADTPKLKELTQDILKKKILNEDKMFFDIDMGHVVGNSQLVENENGDVIVYAKRKNREIYSSFNKSKSSQPCSRVTVIVAKIDDKKYELLSAWIGSTDAPPFPGDENETKESKEYWMKHSLVWGTQEIQAGTETSICPW